MQNGISAWRVSNKKNCSGVPDAAGMNASKVNSLLQKATNSEMGEGKKTFQMMFMSSVYLPRK